MRFINIDEIIYKMERLIVNNANSLLKTMIDTAVKLLRKANSDIVGMH